MNDIIYNWLKGFPGLELLQTEQADEVSGGCGLFFRGVTEKSRKHDLLGSPQSRKTWRYRLQRFGQRAESAVFFLLLGAWAEENPPASGITASLKNARCTRDEDLGLALWQADLEVTGCEP